VGLPIRFFPPIKDKPTIVVLSSFPTFLFIGGYRLDFETDSLVDSIELT
jgi:hypothetical protein